MAFVLSAIAMEFLKRNGILEETDFVHCTSVTDLEQANIIPNQHKLLAPKTSNATVFIDSSEISSSAT